MKRLAVGLLALLLAPSVLAVAPWGDADDAGSGADAPDDASGALPIMLDVTYAGFLAGVRARNAPFLPVADAEDWYRVTLPAHAEVELRLAVQNDAHNAVPLDQVTAALVSPSGATAAWLASPADGVLRSTATLSDATGGWFVRVVTGGVGAAYRFSVHATPDARGLAASGAGAFTTTLDLADGEVAFVNATVTSRDATDRARVFVLADAVTRTVFDWTESGASATQVRAHAAGFTFAETVVSDGDTAFVTVTRRYLIDGPGSFFVATGGEGAATYRTITIDAPNGPGTVAAFGGEAVVSRTLADFDGVASAHARPARIAFQVAHTLHVAHGFVGLYRCDGTANPPPTCTVTTPSGSAIVTDARHFVKDDAGPYRFHRARDTALDAADVVLVGLDVPWPLA